MITMPARARLLQGQLQALESRLAQTSEPLKGPLRQRCERLRTLLQAQMPPVPGSVLVIRPVDSRERDLPTVAAAPGYSALKASLRRFERERLLRRSLAYRPRQAGPLHPERLVNTGLYQLQQLSPGYLHHLLQQGDWLLRSEKALRDCKIAGNR